MRGRAAAEDMAAAFIWVAAVAARISVADELSTAAVRVSVVLISAGEAVISAEPGLAARAISVALDNFGAAATLEPRVRSWGRVDIGIWAVRLTVALATPRGRRPGAQAWRQRQTARRG